MPSMAVGIRNPKYWVGAFDGCWEQKSQITAYLDPVDGELWKASIEPGTCVVTAPDVETFWPGRPA